MYLFKRSIEGGFWPRSRFEYTIGASKDDAGVRNEDAGSSGPVKGISADQVLGPFEGLILRPTDTCPEDGAVCSERILWAAAQRTCPVVFSEMGLSAAGPQDVPATYFVGGRVSQRRQSEERYGRGAALWHPGGACPKTTRPRRIFLGWLTQSDLLLEFCMFQRVP